jgi:hypothetical protein
MFKATGQSASLGNLLGRAAAAAIAGIALSSMGAQVNSNGSLAASPLSGRAPLVVTFTGSGSGELEGVMRLDFGDGDVDDSISTIRGFERTHTYVAPGTYTAELKSGTYRGQQPATLRTVARVTITVR